MLNINYYKVSDVMKKVLITGGNKGIGLEVTKLFIKNNYVSDTIF